MTGFWSCDWHSTAEKNNIPWREMTKEILEADLQGELESIQNPSLVYPDCNFPFFTSLTITFLYIALLYYSFPRPHKAVSMKMFLIQRDFSLLN